MLLSDINAQRAAAGAAPVVAPGTVKPATSATPAPTTTTFDPATRTISGAGAAGAATQSAVNKGTAVTTPSNPTASGAAVTDQNNTRLTSPQFNTPQQVTTFNPVGADLLQGYDATKVNNYVKSGQLTQDQADALLKKSQISPDEALAMGLGKNVTVNGQTDFQNLIKQNLQDTVTHAQSQLSAGLITQADFDKVQSDVQSHTADADRIIASLTPAPVGSQGQAQSRVDDITKQINDLSQPYNPLPYQSVESIAAINESRAQQKMALQTELDHLKVGIQGKTTNTQGFVTPDPNKDPNAPDTTQPTAAPLSPEAQTSLQSLGGVIQSLAASAPPELAPLYQAAFGVLQSRAGDLASDYKDATQMADGFASEYQKIIGGMIDARKSMVATGKSLLQQQQDENIDVLNQQKTADLAANENGRLLFQTQVNNEVRRREYSLSQETQTSMNRIAIQGGFGDMNRYSEVDRAHNEGEQQITSYIGEMSIEGGKYTTNILSIDANYSRNVATAHKTFTDGVLGLMSTYNDKVEEAQKLLLGNAEKRMDAYTKARTDLRTGWAKIQDETISTIKSAATQARQEKLAVDRNAHWDRQTAWSETMNFLSQYGSGRLTPAAKDFLTYQENTLGLPPGTLTNEATLKELKKTGGTGGGGNPLTKAGTQPYVENLRTQVLRAHPEWQNNPEAVDAAVLRTTKANYPGVKNAGLLRDVSDYVNGNNITGSKPYFVNYDSGLMPKFNQSTVDVDGQTMDALSNL